MSAPSWPKDTIAWRFGLTVLAALAATCLLIGLFLTFGGIWARPPMDAAARLEGAGAIIEMVASAAPEMRPQLAAAARTKAYHVGWHAAASAIARGLDAAEAAHRQTPLASVLQEFADTIQRPILVITPSDPEAKSPDFVLRSDQHPDAYFFAVKLTDDSWVVFTGFGRTWGLSYSQRLAIWAVFLALSLGVVSIIAARQLSRPIRHFAAAVRLAGLKPHSPAIAAAGPQELRDVIAAFNDMREQIQGFVAYRTTMLAAISHDLRTPLTRMRLRGEFIDNPSQQAKLFRDVDEMRAMIDGALAFFRGDADEEASRAFDLADIVLSIADDYADQGIDIDYAGPLHMIVPGRPLALKRALTNLVENAVRYGSPPRIALTSTPATISVTIADHGPGIPADAIDTVFKPFFRLDKARKRAGAGSGVGLGLTAAQAIVRAHGGEITLRNRAAGGLEATVTIPRQ